MTTAAEDYLLRWYGKQGFAEIATRLRVPVLPEKSMFRVPEAATCQLLVATFICLNFITNRYVNFSFVISEFIKRYDPF